MSIIIDYAHTPNALQVVISNVLDKYHDLVVVFGCGGNRDKAKRKLMGEAASVSKYVILTNDNPRNEHPQNIINDIKAGINVDYQVIYNRYDAIFYGILYILDDIYLGKLFDDISLNMVQIDQNIKLNPNIVKKIQATEVYNKLYNNNKIALLIAGKGHESVQIENDHIIMFNDKQIAYKILCNIIYWLYNM